MNSPRWNRVSWQAQSFFIRLLTLVDDYGRYDGRASVLWGQCFAVWNEHNPQSAVTLPEVAQMLRQLAADSVQLIELYMAGEKEVLQITQWQERVREGAKERWPKNTKSAASRSVSLPPSSPSPPSPPPAYPAPASDQSTPQGAVEPPAGFPTEQQAVAMGDMAGVPAEFCRVFWNQAMSRGGRDAKGQVIASFRHALKAGWTYDQNRKGERSAFATKAPQGANAAQGGSFWQQSKELELVEKTIKEIEGRATTTATETIIEPKDKDIYRQLRKRRGELKTALGLKAPENKKRSEQ